MSTLTWKLDRVEGAKMKTLALILADPNPIHFDPDAASRLGTGGRLVSQGPGSIGLIYNLFGTELPGQRVRRLDVRLLGNVLEDDEVTVRAELRSDSTYDVTVDTASGRKLTAVAYLEDREI
ncbi:MAG: MaoC family dehydratase [Actinomycetia bacterium]|nr:MaoC family dehydratase [Actinomycetes bacterium]